MTVDDLAQHPFIQRAMRAGVETTVRGDPEPLLDEHDFYLQLVGHAVSALLKLCQQLSYAVFYFTNYRETETMRQAGITRAFHLIYTNENWIIRTQSLYDRVLQLVDAVFHLTNDPTLVTHDIVTRNIKVKQTPIPSVLKPLRKKLREFNEARNKIIHQGAYLEDDLHKLEGIAILEHINPEEQSYEPTKQRLTRKIIQSKKREYGRFNDHVFQLINKLFDALEPYYDSEESRLRTSLGKP